MRSTTTMEPPSPAADVPAGFERHTRRSGLTEPWEPIYARRTETAIILGLRAGPAHINSRGFVHGGLISAMADNAMGLSCGLHVEGATGLVTVSLGLDFIASGQAGQWLAFETSFVRVGGTLAFAQAFITADGEVCARADATFRVLRVARPVTGDA